LSLSEQVHAPQDKASENFKKELLKAINETIFSLLGQGALHSVDSYLKEHYSISPSEWADHLDLLLEMLGFCLGPAAEKTVGRAIAKRLYWKLNIQFTNTPSYTLFDYIDKAKLRIGEGVKNGKES
jgi:hypothetical protein